MQNLIVLLYSFLYLQGIPIEIKLKSNPELFDVDKLGNLYVYADNLLKKYSTNGELLCSFSNLHLGKLHSIDVSDPMQIMLYYRDFEQVVFLDNRLNLLGKVIELNSLVVNSVSAACKSKQSAIWLYDNYENELILYSYTAKRIIERCKLPCFEQKIENINFILEYSGLLYLNDSNKCIWIFDKFGNELQKINMKTISDFQITNTSILCRNQYFNKSAKSSFVIKNIDNIKYSNNKFYILKDKNISIINYTNLPEYCNNLKKNRK